MTRRIVLFIVGLACAGVVLGQNSPTQITSGNDTGFRPFQTYAGIREQINLSNGNLHLELPLISLPGRNGLNTTLAVQYDSKIWEPHAAWLSPSDLQYRWLYEQRSPAVGGIGWRFNIPAINEGDVVSDSNGNPIGLSDSIVQFADGGKHNYGTQRGGGVPVNVLDADDGSFSTIDRSNPSDVLIRQKDGTVLHFPDESYSTVSKIEDSNGNFITYGPNGITDTLARQITITSNGSTQTTISYLDSNNVQRSITLTFTLTTLFPSADFPSGTVPFSSPVQVTCLNCTNIWVQQPALNQQFYMLTSIGLPNQTSYTFQYNDYGELTKVTYPTGAYTQYTYASFQYEQVYWSDHALNVTSDFREVTSKTVCSNSSTPCSAPSVTTYQPSVSSSDANNIQMVVTDPGGYKTAVTFSDNAAPGDWTAKYYPPRETDRTLYQLDGVTPARTIHTDYNSIDASVGGYYLPIRVTTTLNDVSPPRVTKTETSYDSFTATVQWETWNDFANWDVESRTRYIDNPTQVTYFDYGINQNGPLLKYEKTIWANNVTSPSLWQNHIWNRPGLRETHNGTVPCLNGRGDDRCSQTQYEYDNYTQGIAGTGATQHESVSGSRGNTTAVTHWRSSDGAYLTTRNQFDDTGNVISTFDPAGHTVSYGFSPMYQAAYLTSVTYPNTFSPSFAAHSESFSYFFQSGALASHTDQNGHVTSYRYDDPLGRRTQENRPVGGGGTTWGYNDLSLQLTQSDTLDANGTTRTTITAFDGLGRITSDQLLDSQGTDVTSTTYDSRSNVLTVSNPYRSTSDLTYGVTCHGTMSGGTCFSGYDAVGRLTVVTNQDGSRIQTNYSAFPSVITTDETGRMRQTTVDALGRLTDVYEPNPNTGSLSSGSFHTQYVYDGLSNLRAVNQYGDGSASARVRTFNYDSLSQLTSATNPESGTLSYAYDNVGNLASKTGPTGQGTATLSYCYDALNRLTSKAYSQQSCPMGSPAATYSYDQSTNAVGRRTGMTDPSGTTTWAYDTMGRVVTVQQTVNVVGSTPKSSSYGYWFNGALKSLTYPSGRSINYDIDSTGRTKKVYKTTPGTAINYVEVNSFHPHGAPREVVVGAGGCFVGALAEFTYNNRLQPWHILYTTNTNSGATQSEAQNSSCVSNGGELMHRLYSFSDNFNGAGDNGNVARITNCLDTNRNQSFSYDALNRITTAATDGPSWGEQFTIDPWGNLTNIATTKGTAETLDAAPANSSNQLNGFGYDAAGNQTGPDAFGHRYSYDAENRIASVDSGATVYTNDGEGNRVIKNNGGGVGMVYWRGATGDVLAESDLSGALTSEYIFFNGRRIARTDNPSSSTGASLKYYLSDHLGSTSILTDATFSTVLEGTDYFPFGREVAQDSQYSNADHYKFTGKERDSETGLDYFGARYLGSSMGRFMSPDPRQDSGFEHMDDPQSWNGYSYVRVGSSRVDLQACKLEYSIVSPK